MLRSAMTDKSRLIISTAVILAIAAVSLTAHLLISTVQFINPVARISQNGELLYEVSLFQNTIIELDSNTIQISGGKIAVTWADCPDQTCVNTGFISGAIPIICIPNRLEIKITDSTDLDGITR